MRPREYLKLLNQAQHGYVLKGLVYQHYEVRALYDLDSPIDQHLHYKKRYNNLLNPVVGVD